MWLLTRSLTPTGKGCVDPSGLKVVDVVIEPVGKGCVDPSGLCQCFIRSQRTFEIQFASRVKSTAPLSLSSESRLLSRSNQTKVKW